MNKSGIGFYICEMVGLDKIRNCVHRSVYNSLKVKESLILYNKKKCVGIAFLRFSKSSRPKDMKTMN